MNQGAGEMGQRFRVFAALAEDLGSIPQNPHCGSRPPKLQFQGDFNPLLTSSGTRHAHGAHKVMQTKCSQV